MWGIPSLQETYIGGVIPYMQETLMGLIRYLQIPSSWMGGHIFSGNLDGGDPISARNLDEGGGGPYLQET